MEQQPAKKAHGPKSKSGKLVLCIILTILIGLVYFYVALPPINPQSGDFYVFIAVLCIVFVVTSILTSGMDLIRDGSGPKDYLRFIKSRCLPAGILLLVLIAIGIVGTIISLPIFRAGAYRDLLTVEDGNFATDIAEISFNEIPTLDESSAEYLSDRQMGTLSDMVSQFEYSFDSSQINYKGRPVRVAPIAYADLFKWFTNRGNGLPAYVRVDMVTQEATVVRLEEGMKYSFSEPLKRNIKRHLRFNNPTIIFGTPQFDIDEEGHPYWIAPRIVKTIGLFGGDDIQGAVLVDAITGECTYYELADIPSWVDNVFTPELIMEQYDYHGTLVNGFINSIFGQRDVTITTSGSNYIALNDDVYMYTGVTSANADQDLKYTATFPLLLNIAGEPTYFIPLKDATNLVKSYAMVNVAQYQVVATGSTVSACEQEYIKLLNNKGITTPEDTPRTEVSGVISDIRSAVMEGNSYYFIQLEGDPTYYAISAAQNPLAVILNVGDQVTIQHTPAIDGETSSILDGSTITLDGAAQPAPSPIVTPSPQEETDTGTASPSPVPVE